LLSLVPLWTNAKILVHWKDFNEILREAICIQCEEGRVLVELWILLSATDLWCGGNMFLKKAIN
jgi:hypothetical protein